MSDTKRARLSRSAGSAPAGWAPRWPAGWPRPARTSRCGTAPGPRRRRSPIGLRRRRHDRRSARQRRGVHDGVHPGRSRAGAARRGRAAGRPEPRARRRGRLLDGLDRVVGRDARRVRGAGVDFLAAPVSGNGKVVAAGRLTLVVSGSEATYDKVAHLLGHMGKSVRRTSARATSRGWRRSATTSCSAWSPRRWPRSPCWPRRAASRGGVPGVPQQQRDGLGLHPLQVPGVREPRLHADVHAGPAAQGLRPRARGGPRARRADAGRGGDRAAGAGERQQRPGRRGLRDPARPAGAASGLELEPENRRSTTGCAADEADVERRRPPAARPGHMGVDYEQRVDFDRLREYRLGRAKAALEASECGAFLLFDFYNIRYTTQTWIGGALGDKMTRYALLTRGGEPDAVGLRLGREAPPAVRAVARRGELPGRDARPARRDRADARADGGRGRARSRAARGRRGGRRSRSGSTSSSRRSCSRCSGRA